MEISWADHVRSEEVLQRVEEEKNTIHTIHRKKANWIGRILRKNWLLTYVAGGKIEGWAEVTDRRVRRRKQVLDDFNEKKRILEIERGSTRSYSLQNLQ
jgi:hypothetical protein